MEKHYCVYILTNKRNTVLYNGVTSDLKKRVYQHREKLMGGFTNFYNVTKLVFYEVTDNVNSAIAGEKQIKAGSRKKKIDLVNGMNPEWRDLHEDLYSADQVFNQQLGGLPLRFTPRNDTIGIVIVTPLKIGGSNRPRGAGWRIFFFPPRIFSSMLTRNPSQWKRERRPCVRHGKGSKSWAPSMALVLGRRRCSSSAI